MHHLPKQIAAVTAALALAAAAASCGSSSSSSSNASSSGGGAVPQVDVTKFTADFAVMKTLQSLAAQGKGKIGVLLPDTTTSTRYVQYDAPNLTRAFEAAGLSSSDFKITNAQGSVSTMQQQAEADITDGASVLLIDPIDTGSGAAIEKNAEAKGLKVIDYDRLVLGGPADRYYVSFNNVKVGQLIGQGEISCINAWGVKNPNILIMDGDPTDNNAKLFAQGYNGVLAPKFADGTYKKVGEPTGTWDPPTAQTTFEQQYTAHPNINAVVTPNDSNAAAVIAALKNKKIPPKTFPTTGQDAGLRGSAEHPRGLPVRHRLQAVLPRGAGRGSAGPVPAGRPDAAVDAGQLDHQGQHDRRQRQVGLHPADLGDRRQHERHGRQGRHRDGEAAVLGRVPERL